MNFSFNPLDSTFDLTGGEADSLRTATGVVSGVASAAPSPGQTLIAIDESHFVWGFPEKLFAGSMAQTTRTGCGVPFPEYAVLSGGGGYVTPPEPNLASQLFELTLAGGSEVIVTWCDERHVGTHDFPATGTGTLTAGALDATLTYGHYTVHIVGAVTGATFAGTVTTTVAGVTEVHTISSAASASTLTFPANCRYYSTSGNDSNDGLSLKAPKLTLPAPVAATNYCLERRSIFTTPFGNATIDFNIYDCGAGHRPIFNQFSSGLTWTDAGSGAWTTTVHGVAAIAPELPGLPHCIVDGNLMKWVADLATVRTTAGSFAVVGSFSSTGSDATVYIHPAAATNPNTDGHIYEVCTGELATRAISNPIVRGVIGRGCTSNTGCISTLTTRTFAQWTWTNCDAHFGRKHNFGGNGGTSTNCISWKLQQSTAAEYSAHFVTARIGDDPVLVPSTFVNCACIGQSDGVIGAESGILVEVQTGTVPTGAIAVNQLYVAYLAGSAISQTMLIPSCVLDDLLVERLHNVNSSTLGGGKYTLNRPRVYALGAYDPGLRLSTITTRSLEIHHGLFVGGQPPSGAGIGYIYQANSPDIADPMVLISEDSTYVHIGSHDNTRPCVEIYCQGSDLYGQFTWNRNVISGFGFAFETSGALSVTPQPQRIASDYNSWGSYVNSFVYGYSSVSVANTTYSLWCSGATIWAASDVHSVAAAVTFSNTTGRYPSYTKTSAGPGGYTQTFLDPTTYLGVQFLAVMEAAGQYPA